MSRQCKVFGDLAEGFSDFSNDESLVQLFSAVLARRDKLDEYTKILDEEEEFPIGGVISPRLVPIVFREITISRSIGPF